MIKYAIKRLLWIIPVALCTAILTFTIMHFCPGDAATMMLSSTATQEEIDALRDSLGLNDPFLIQLKNYLVNVFLKFDFGKSYMNGTSISTQLAQRFPLTLLIAIICIILSLLIGVPLGIFAALHRGKLGDTLSRLIAMIGVSMPNFWFALLLILLFSLILGWLPPLGYEGIEYFIMPCIACSVNGIAAIARQTRASTLGTLREDYIITAKAKGLSNRKIIITHVLPNSLIPVVTVAGGTFGRLLSGTMIIESIFSIPGIGSYVIGGINNRDYPVVQGGVIFISITFSFIMLLVDLVYAAVDPRIRAQYAGRKRR